MDVEPFALDREPSFSMDDTTEPVIAVIGHPIAGNPAQFALERALAASDLDWRVLSFEIDPDRVDAALDGLEALGFRGVLADHSTAGLVDHWFRRGHEVPNDVSGILDCLWRESVTVPFRAMSAGRQGLLDLVEHHATSGDQGRTESVSIGPPPDEPNPWPGSWFQNPIEPPPEPEELEQAKLIVLTGSANQPVLLEGHRWPPDDGSTLVIDLTEDGHPELEIVDERGYRVISGNDQRVSKLIACLRCWTGGEPMVDVVRDAIEEYLAV